MSSPSTTGVEVPTPCGVADTRLFAADAETPIPLDTLCDVLLSKWARPPCAQYDVAPVDTTFLQYTYDSCVFYGPDPFFGAQLASVPLSDYVARLAQYLTTTPFPCAVMALRLIDKYCHSTVEVVALNNAHLLIGTAMMVASKALCDEHMSWEYYCRVIGAPSALLVNLEVILLFECRWDILPSLAEYAQYRALLLPQSPPLDASEPHLMLLVPKERMGVSVTSSGSSGGMSDSEPSTLHIDDPVDAHVCCVYRQDDAHNT